MSLDGDCYFLHVISKKVSSSSKYSKDNPVDYMADLLVRRPLSSSEAPLNDFVGPSNPAELRRQERVAPAPTEY